MSSGTEHQVDGKAIVSREFKIFEPGVAGHVTVSGADEFVREYRGTSWTTPQTLRGVGPGWSCSFSCSRASRYCLEEYWKDVR